MSSFLPYSGSCKQYNSVGEDGEIWGEMPFEKMGLCTTDGTIVTDAVYSSIYKASVGKGENGLEYYTLTKEFVHGTDENGFPQADTITTVCALDGSWSYTAKDRSINHIVFDSQSGKMRVALLEGNVMTGPDFTYSLVDVQSGKTLMTESVRDGWIYFGDFNGGIAPVTVTTYGEEVYSDGYYIDLDGNKLFGGFSDCTEFSGGVAVVHIYKESDDGEKKARSTVAGVIDTNGEYIVPPQYDYIYLNGSMKCALFEKDDEHYLGYYSDPSKLAESIRKLDSPAGMCTYSFVGKDSGILHCYNRRDGFHEFTDLKTGKKIVSKQYGKSPNIAPNWDSDILALYDKSTRQFTFMDKSGETLAQYTCPSDSDYFNSLSESYVTIYANETYDSLAVLDIKNNKLIGTFDNTDIYQAIGDRYLVMSTSWQEGDEWHHSYSLYDAKTGEYLLQGIKELTPLYFENAGYFRYFDGAYLYLACVNDGEVQVIMKIRNPEDY